MRILIPLSGMIEGYTMSRERRVVKGMVRKADKIGNVFAFIKIIGHQFFYKWSGPAKQLNISPMKITSIYT